MIMIFHRPLSGPQNEDKDYITNIWLIYHGHYISTRQLIPTIYISIRWVYLYLYADLKAVNSLRPFDAYMRQ